MQPQKKFALFWITSVTKKRLILTIHLFINLRKMDNFTSA